MILIKGEVYIICMYIETDIETEKYIESEREMAYETKKMYLSWVTCKTVYLRIDKSVSWCFPNLFIFENFYIFVHMCVTQQKWIIDIFIELLSLLWNIIIYTECVIKECLKLVRKMDRK